MKGVYPRRDGPGVRPWSSAPMAPPSNPAASLAVRNHSQMGFSRGYSGSGPAQLALALLLDGTDDPAARAARLDAVDAWLAGYVRGMPG